tara:strand:- start:281 stop:712 length:432 start_codon:yes stop_codon:yes gene_type:complete
MVRIEVQIPEGMHEFLWAKVARFGYHHQKEGVGGDIEGYSEKNIRAPLVELAAKVSFRDVKLEESMTWRQGHLFQFARVPCAHYVPATVRVFSNGTDHFFDLVYGTSVGFSPVGPLGSVDSAEVAICIRPFVPNTYLVFVKVL